MTSPKLLLVLSEQRSGSTFFSEALASVLPCGIALGESMLPNAGGEGFDQRPFAAALNPRLRHKRSSLARAWLMHVREHACAERKCACIGVVKLFRTHPVGKLAMRRLVTSPDVASVVLKRNASDVECSLRWARQTSDFASTPRERNVSGRFGAYAQFRSNCVPTTAFAAQHDAWFAQLRSLGVRLEVPFGAMKRNTTEALQRVARALNVPIARWEPPPPNHTRPLPPATLALSTIVTHQSARFAGWLAHHLSLGVNEIHVFWLAGVPEAVARKAHARVRHHDLETALAEGHHRTWWLAWKGSSWCASRANKVIMRMRTDRPDMCLRRLYMPEQALVFRYVARNARSAWLLAIDVDETLRGRWREYLSALEARTRVPGGVRVAQVQLVGDGQCLAPRRGAFKNEKKALVRRTAVHPDARAFASIHEPTLAKGAFYLDAPTKVLALAHARYFNWTGRVQQPPEVPRSLRCAAEAGDCRRAVAWWHRFRVREYADWKSDLSTRRQLPMRDCLPVSLR